MRIIKEMYNSYLKSLKEGLRNQIRTFTFRNVDSIFLDPVELDNNGNIFLGFENRFINMVLDYIRTDEFRKQFVLAIVSQIPGWRIPISIGYIQNLFRSFPSLPRVIELEPTIMNP